MIKVNCFVALNNLDKKRKKKKPVQKMIYIFYIYDIYERLFLSKENNNSEVKFKIGNQVTL